MIEVNHVTVEYLTGDIKNIGLKEYLLNRLTGKYEIKKF